LRIFEAETISSARVTLRMFCVLLILDLISRPPAISFSLAVLARVRAMGAAAPLP